MKNIILTALLLAVYSVTYAQFEKKRDEIVKEGKLLYRSEMASWYGTDIFMEKYNNNPPDSSGYFSYTGSDNLSTCVFFSKKGIPSVIFTATFDSTYDVKTARVDMVKRDFTAEEKVLFTIRTKALSMVRSDTFFREYKRTDLNLVPVVENGEKKVYVLTGPHDNGVVIFGNDYLLTFDNKDEIKSKKRLHKNIMVCQTADTTTGGVHSHLPETGDFITSTDICTLMLYQHLTHWTTYTVVSADYFSIWNCRENQLAIMRRDVIEKINKDQEHRNKAK